MTEREATTVNLTWESWKLFLRSFIQSYADIFLWLKNLLISNKEKRGKDRFYSSVTGNYIDFFKWFHRLLFPQQKTKSVLKVMLNIESLSAYFDNLRPVPIHREVIESAHPFHLEGFNDYGVLLVHGFCSNPLEMRELGELLQNNGYTVEAILVKGHGTSVNDLTGTEFLDWYESVLQGYDKLSKKCSNIFVIGHSMGGTLSLLLASNREVDAIISLCAPLNLGKFHGLPIPLLPAVSKFISKWPKKKEHMKLHKEAGVEAYTSSSLSGVVEMFDLMEVTREEISKIEAPLLIVGASHDYNVPLSNISLLEQVVKSKKVETFTATRSGHTVLFDQDKEEVFYKVLTFLETVRIEKKQKSINGENNGC